MTGCCRSEAVQRIPDRSLAEVTHLAERARSSRACASNTLMLLRQKLMLSFMTIRS
jgi:hypothetical protein